MDWLPYVIGGSFAYTTLALGWLKVEISRLWTQVNNHTRHELDDLSKRIDKLESYHDGR